MKRISLKDVIMLFENKYRTSTYEIFYKNEDDEFVMVKPLINAFSEELEDLIDEERNNIKEEFSLSKLMNLNFYIRHNDETK